MFIWAVFALAALAALFALGVGAERADAQTPFISAGGPYQGVVGQPIQFTGNSAIGSVVNATWTFSDGTSMTGLSVVKSFAAPGSFSATLTVTDAAGRPFSDTAAVTVLASTGFGNTTALVNGQIIEIQSGSALASLPPNLGSSVVVVNGQLVPTTGFVNVNGQIIPPSAFGNVVTTPAEIAGVASVAQVGANVVTSDGSVLQLGADEAARLAGQMAAPSVVATQTAGSLPVVTCSDTASALFAFACSRP